MSSMLIFNEIVLHFKYCVIIKMIRTFTTFISLAFSIQIPKSITNNFVSSQINKYNLQDNNIYDSENIHNVYSLTKNYDLMIFNTTDLTAISNRNLDNFILKAQEKLNNLGMIFLDPKINSPPHTSGFGLLLNNPQELWNYNLVNVEIYKNNTIFARKGSASISKNRQLLIFNPNIDPNSFNPTININGSIVNLKFFPIKTGNVPFDYFFNMISFLFQYMFIFNFFSFGAMFLFNTIVTYKNTHMP